MSGSAGHWLSMDIGGHVPPLLEPPVCRLSESFALNLTRMPGGAVEGFGLPKIAVVVTVHAILRRCGVRGSSLRKRRGNGARGGSMAWRRFPVPLPGHRCMSCQIRWLAPPANFTCPCRGRNISDRSLKALGLATMLRIALRAGMIPQKVLSARRAVLGSAEGGIPR